MEWLEEFLRGYDGAVVVISHDRYCLDKVTTRTLELSHGALYATNGNYSAHREKREKDAEIAQKHYKHAMQEIKKLEEISPCSNSGTAKKASSRRKAGKNGWNA